MSGFSVGSAETLQNAMMSQQEIRRLREAATDFEALFLKQMLTAMRRTVPKSPEGEGALVRESQGEKIFRDMLDGEYAKIMSQRGRGFGLREAVMKHAMPQTAPFVASENGRVDPQAEVLRLQNQSDSLNALRQIPIKMGGGR